MADLSDYRIPPPDDWEEFESLCLQLWREIWEDPGAKKNGRRGQPDAGVDVFGELNGSGRYAGIQCKCRRAGRELNVRDLEEAVQKAQIFDSALAEFVLATTGRRDAKLQRKARELTRNHRQNGLFSVAVWAWDDILEELELFPEIGRRYCRGLPLDFDEIARGKRLTCVFSGARDSNPVDYLFARLKEVGERLGLAVVRCERCGCRNKETRDAVRGTLDTATMVVIETGDVRGQVAFELSHAIDRCNCTLFVPKDHPDTGAPSAAAAVFGDVTVEEFTYQQLFDSNTIDNLLECFVKKSLEQAARWSAQITGRSIQRAGRLPETLIDPSLSINGELFP